MAVADEHVAVLVADGGDGHQHTVLLDAGDEVPVQGGVGADVVADDEVCGSRCSSSPMGWSAVSSVASISVGDRVGHGDPFVGGVNARLLAFLAMTKWAGMRAA